ncbi:hypothetical protein P691DRAFT_683401 [Macrolepiota fuliginosa MF-IS2]|uniref:Uncharacterized protein n=1 Tax=Macrolepiota fuliginosa MF-IS2 TaxID=1400762 RepID=A0A9P5X1H3_9AGAR|nr:hypothetical protein P691DRAFT_683401 [Macrolepiota fuliginosa MF-IS2]
MNSVNTSTSLSGFQLKTGSLPCIIPSPPNIPQKSSNIALKSACEFVKTIQHHIHEAQDNLLAAKIVQAHYANNYCNDNPNFKISDQVLLNTTNHHCNYVQKGSGRVGKFMP